jgi:EpsG family
MTLKVFARIDSFAISLLVLLLFLIQPFLTLVMVVVLAMTINDLPRRYIYVVALIGSCYLGLINATKYPDSDLINYLDWFASARELPLNTFLLTNSREPLYFLGLYGIANLPYSSNQLFVFLSTLISYLIFLFAVIRTGVHLKIRGKVIIAYISLLLFFAPLFSLSAHLMRQFLAASIVTLFLSEYIASGKRRWGILLTAILIHYSAAVFIFVALLKKHDKLTSTISLVLYVVTLPLIYIVSKSVAPLFSDVPVLGFVFTRVAAEEGADLENLSTIAILFSLAMILVSTLNMRLLRRTAGTEAGLWCVNIGVIIIGIISIIANTQTQLSEIAIRFFFYLYFLSGLTLSMQIASLTSPQRLLAACSLIVYPLFTYKLQFGEWSYAPLSNLLISPSWHLWSYSTSG